MDGSLLHQLAELAREMRRRPSLEQLLELIAVRSSTLLGVQRVSVRLLDQARAVLLAVARAGSPVHDQPVEFRLGEGLLGWIAQESRSIRIADAESDPRFAPRDGRSGRIGAFLGVPIAAGASCMGVISVVSPDREFTAEDEDLLTLVAELSAPYVEIARLSRLSRVDPLTGSLNRRGLDEAFPEMFASARGLLAPLSVVMMDLDHFKSINDEHGHAVGDLVLKRIVDIAGKVLRTGDAVVRVGGEEFLLVLPAAGLEDALHVAERCREAIAANPIPVGETGVAVTASFGVAERREGEERDDLIARADAALYRAKHGGRNHVVAADQRRSAASE